MTSFWFARESYIPRAKESEVFVSFREGVSIFFESWKFEGEVWLTKSVREREESRKKGRGKFCFRLGKSYVYFPLGVVFFLFRDTAWSCHPPLPCRKVREGLLGSFLRKVHMLVIVWSYYKMKHCSRF